MAEPLDDQYFAWLYRLVASPRTRNPDLRHVKLLLQLYRKEFVWTVANDDNRVADGLDLRHEFKRHEGIDAPEEWLSMGCSFLEMLIALARRFAFEAEFTEREWFWHMMRNIEIDHIADYRYTAADREYVDEVLEQVIFRTYEPSGKGGLFPLAHPEEDQRKVELWYQLSAYILERD